MFHHILVPLDGSTRAEQILPVAARLARSSGAMITLFQASDLSHDLFDQRPDAPTLTQQTIDDEFSCSHTYLEQVCQHHFLEGIPVRTQVAWGNPADAIVAQATRLPLDLILIASHGYSGLKRRFLGSTAEQVACTASVPVFILHDGRPLRLSKNFAGQRQVRALVPLDASPRSLDALAPAAELVAVLSPAGQGELHLTQMVPLSEATAPREQEVLLAAANQRLAAVCEQIQEGLINGFDGELHPTLSWSAEPAVDIAETLVLLAENGQENPAGQTRAFDFIALTTHNMGGIHHWLEGSLVERILRLTRLPILVVHAAEMSIKGHQQSRQEAIIIV